MDSRRSTEKKKQHYPGDEFNREIATPILPPQILTLLLRGVSIAISDSISVEKEKTIDDYYPQEPV